MTKYLTRAVVLFTILCCGWLVPNALRAEPPKVADPRLSIELFAESPDIKTPIGMVVDPKDRVLVVESHTHQRPSGYVGPATDRIRLLEDTKGTGKADRVETYFEGTSSTMCLTIGPDGSLYVATRSEIFKLSDSKGDGAAKQAASPHPSPLPKGEGDEKKPEGEGAGIRKTVRTQIARLETTCNYPHDGIEGMAFDFHGDLYFGMGENLGAPYKLIGSDGATHSGGGEGGNFFRCHADGSHLERFATGFWNPFQCSFDIYGQLFSVENDPDSRPPCKLLQIVEGGDYGFRFRYGRKGTHPFQAWNGELPGTLPMASAVGEAPSGLVAYESDNLPAEYRGELFGTSWGDHRVDRFTLSQHGAAAWAKMTPLVTGGDDFRPAAVAVAPDGSLFISDWADKSYSVHGKGRIWHVRAKDGKKVGRRESGDGSYEDRLAAVHSADRLTRENAARRMAGDEAARAALRTLAREDSDARIRAVAIQALADVADSKTDFLAIALGDRSHEIREMTARCMPDAAFDAVKLADASQPAEVRAAALRRSNKPAARDAALAALDQDDPFLQQAARQALINCPAALASIDAAKLTIARQRLGVLLALRSVREADSRKLLPQWLSDADPSIKFAAIQWVGEEHVKELRPRIAAMLSGEAATRELFEACVATLELLDGAQKPDEFHGEEYVVRALTAAETSPAMRGLALQLLRPDHPVLTLDKWRSLLATDDPGQKLEVVRSLRMSPHAGRVELLAAVATDSHAPPQLRDEAIVGLAEFDAERPRLLSLASDVDPTVRREALRGLRGMKLSAEQLAQLKASSSGDGESGELIAHIPPPIETGAAKHDVDTWLKQLDGPAGAAAGARIFFHSRTAGCYKCHQSHGRGGAVGPDLTTAAKQLTRRKLIESIVDPSKEIAPRFIPWSLVLKDGRALTGQLVSEGPGDLETYADTTGKLFVLKPDQIDQRTPLATSIMPEGLADSLTTQEFRDLLAYLTQQ